MKEETLLLIVRYANEGLNSAQDYLKKNKEELLTKYPGLLNDGVWWFWKGECIGRLTIDFDSMDLYQEFEHGKTKGLIKL